MSGGPLWLGAAGAGEIGAGPKAASLDRAARLGLPVPKGVVVTDEAYRRAVRPGEPTSADAVVDTLELRGVFDGAVAVRSAFSAEDGEARSMAGAFETVLRVDAGSPHAMAVALARVWGSADAAPAGVGVDRRDMLVMEMVAARVAGVAFTESEFEDDLVEVVEGTAERLVGGEVPGTRLELPKLGRWERRADESETPWMRRLRGLLRDVRRAFGVGGWDVEWADDGERIWLLQVRPITRAPRRDELFTLANHKEILPDLPSHFMTTLIASCADRLFEYYRRFDDDLPAERPFIEIFKGRPVINLSLLLEMMRAWGLPTSLVTDSIGTAAANEHPARPMRMVRKLPSLSRMGLAQALAVRSAAKSMRAIRQRTELRCATFGGAVEVLRWLYVRLVHEMFGLTAAMSAPLAICRRLGVLEEHAARHRTIATVMFDELDELRGHAAGWPKAIESLERGELPEDASFRERWSLFLERFGHRGVYESDIARPRFRETARELLASLAPAVPQRRGMPVRTWRGRLTAPLFWWAARAMRAREELRHEAMAATERVRVALISLAADATRDGRLPGVEAIWQLSIDEVRQLDTGWRADEKLVARRRRERLDLAEYRLPDVFARSFDFETVRAGRRDAIDRGARRMTGMSLVAGDVEGRAWVLDAPSTSLPAGFDPSSTILVARAIDAGWVPTLALVAGVVVETGGDLSHGSIIVREVGVPAVTNVAGVGDALTTGRAVTLRAAAGVVEIHEAEDRAAGATE